MAEGTKLFSELKCISKSVLAVLKQGGFDRATPVQEAVIPLFCQNKDVAVDASTGSGKTLAFIVPLIERLLKLPSNPGLLEVIAIVVSPTRELALQTHSVAKPFFTECTPNHALVPLIGGTDVSEDVSMIKSGGAAVLVGTPGRIFDVLTRCSALTYKTFEMLILDEADRLLDMGFQKQLDAIMSKLPRQRRTGLFSATQTAAVESLMRAGLRNPFRVNVAVAAPSSGPTAPTHASSTPQKTPLSLDISYATVPGNAKVPHLLAFLAEHKRSKCIVYFLTCASVDYFALTVPLLPETQGLNLMALHGGLKQQKRNSILQAFRDAPAATLLCTDVAARGLDIPDVHYIFQFDPPQNPANFVHRCGRTARAGRAGRATVLLTPEEDVFVELMRGRGVPLQEEPAREGEGGVGEGRVAEVAAAARKLSETQREAMEKGTKAFVAYVRGYKEHHCKYVFQMAQLDLNHLAQTFGLLRLPVMKEVRQAKKGRQEFVQSEVDVDSVPYRSKQREALRLQELAQCAKAGKDRATVKAERARERAATAAEGAKAAEARKLPSAKRKLLQGRVDMEELEDDYRLMRKLKKGKITDDEYVKAMKLDE